MVHLDLRRSSDFHLTITMYDFSAAQTTVRNRGNSRDDLPENFH